jgi:DNA-binding IclR family transcriptional regulator
MRSAESNKAKIAHRVIEVLDFFDDKHQQATVMDIVRRYNWPQSSTSELLSSLANLGLLYKDPSTRSYCPTPRAALLGTATQPDMIRDGRLVDLVDRLMAQTGLSVAVFGMVGVNAQIFSWRAGTAPLGTARATGPLYNSGLCSGMQDRLTDSAAGMLLLSTIQRPRRDGVIRRLNAEAPENRKFNFATMGQQIQAVEHAGYACGVAGFGSIADVCAVLLPGQPMHQPIALGFVYEPSARIDVPGLAALLKTSVARLADHGEQPTQIVQLSSAA